MIHTTPPRRLLALVFALALVAVARPRDLAAQQLKHGDVNNDGVVSALDAQAILTAVVGLPLPAGFVLANGDANCDNNAAALDAQIVLSHVIGLDVSQYCVGQAFGVGAITITLTPTDTAVLVNKGLRLRATLKDSAGFTVQRPIAWTSNNTALITIDSTRGDTAWVSNKGAAVDATATITASADGVSKATTVRVHSSFAGIFIKPERGDTIFQLNGSKNFEVRLRDSVGTLSGTYPVGLWTIADTGIAGVTASPLQSVNVNGKTQGTTWLRVVNQSNPSDKDSVPVTVKLPAINSCTGDGGTLHSSQTYTTPQTWSPATNPHYLSGTLSFNAGSKLTIEPGTLICAISGSYMLFKAGSSVTAIGTVAAPIAFKTQAPTDYWYGIQLGEATGYVTTPLADTSRFRNVSFEHSYYNTVDGRAQHVVLMDSVRIRQAFYGAVSLMSPGSLMIRSMVDSSAYDYSGYYAVTLGRASLEESVIRSHNSASGIYINEAGTVRQVTIIGGTTAIKLGSSADSARLNDVTISGTTGVALDLDGGLIHPLSGNVTVTGGQAGVFRGGIGNFAHLYADSVAQEALKNNGKDTVHIYYGALVNRTLTLRPDLAWKFEGSISVDTLAQLVVRPGANLDFGNGGLYFQRGGTLDARGTATKRIRFRPLGANYFYGLDFENPGQGSSPFSSAPVAQSTLTNVQVDSASGVCCAGSFGYGAVVGADRHRLIIDSAHIRLSHNGGVHLSARGSTISRSVIDTTGLPTTSYVALGLGDSTFADSVTVRRSGYIGVNATGAGARLRKVRILNSVNYGLYAENGVLLGDSGSVTMEGNAYPGRFRIENLAILAPDSAAQRALFSSTTTDSVIVVNGGNLTRDTVTAIPQLRWQVENQVYFDTLAHFKPRPGARISANNGGLIFRQGGSIDARGTNALPIRFYPAAANVNFYGLDLESPGMGSSPFATAPRAESFLINVRVDSASGQCCSSSFGYAAVSAADRHKVTIDSSRFRLSHNGAVHLAAWGSRISRSIIDTTGTPTTSYVALGLGDSTFADSVTVRRSGQVGVSATGTGARLRNVRILNSVQYGLYAETGIVQGDSGSVVMEGNQYAGRVRIENLGILAPDSASQRAWYSSTTTDSVLVVRGGNLTKDTVTAIPQLRWQVEQDVYFDTLSLFKPRPGARISGYNGGLYFRQGGTIDARGTATMPIRFYPAASNANFYGLDLDNPGAGSSPFATAPVAQSYLINVKVDSASGMCCSSSFGYAAVSAMDRHRVTIDSSSFRMSHNGAVHLATRGSRIARSVIDTTGQPTTSYVALGLSDSTTAENVTVRRSGHVGVNATGAGARLINVTVLNSVQYGLGAESGTLRPDSNYVTLTGNSYAGRLTLPNVAVVMRDSVAQARAVGNASDILVVRGGTLTSDTVTAIPLLVWQVETDPLFSTDAQFRPKKGARITGNNASLRFDNGGTIYAVGTATDTIRFYPAASNVNFHGIWLDNPVSGRDTSVFQYVRMDSIFGEPSSTGGFSDYAAIKAGSAHVVFVSNAYIRKTQHAAISAKGRGSRIIDVRIDTTGVAPAFTTSYSAIAISDSGYMSNVTVRRAGNTGYFLEGMGLFMSNVRAVGGVATGFTLNTPSATYEGQSSVYPGQLVIADSNAGVGFSIRADTITLRYCYARGNGTHGAATDNNRKGVNIAKCDFIDNVGNGVNNFDLSVTENANVIMASDNYWGYPGGPATPGDGKSNNVNIVSSCSTSCTNLVFVPYQGLPPTPAIPPPQHPLKRERRRRPGRKRRP